MFEVDGGWDEWLLAARCRPCPPSGWPKGHSSGRLPHACEERGHPSAWQALDFQLRDPNLYGETGREWKVALLASPHPLLFPACSFPFPRRILPRPYHIPFVPLVAFCCTPPPSKPPRSYPWHGLPGHRDDRAGHPPASHSSSAPIALKNIYMLSHRLCYARHHVESPSSGCCLP